MDFDKSILDEFITEVKEHLSTVEDDLLNLEKGAGDSAFADTVNKVFRAVHTVKGTAGFLGLKTMAEVAHLAETILSMLRAGELKPDATLTDALLGAVDTIRGMLGDVEHSNEQDVSATMARLKAVLDAKGALPAQAPPTMEEILAEAKLAADAKLAEEEKPAPEAPAAPTTIVAAAVKHDAPPPPPKPDGPSDRRSVERGGGESVRIKVGVLNKLMQLAGELVLVRNQQLLAKEKSDQQLRGHIQRLNLVTTELQETIMATRMQPIGNILGKFPRVVRDLGKKLEKNVELEITGNEVELDNTILEALNDPLTHLVRNCCDHGIEAPEKRAESGKPEMGKILLRAYHGNGQVNIEITDDGKGIDPKFIRRKVLEKGLKTEADLSALNDDQITSLILLPGFSTAEKLSDVSGRGVGMDVVKTSIEKLGGTLDIESRAGVGTTIRMRMPLTLAIIPSLIVTIGDFRYAIPQTNVEELACLYDDDVRNKIESAGAREVYRLRDQLLPMVRLEEVLKRKDKFTETTNSEIMENHRQIQEKKYTETLNKQIAGGNADVKLTQSLNFVVLRVNTVSFGLIVDRVIGTEEIVVKPMHPALKNLYCYAGVTVMGDGNVALILDAQGVAKHAGIDIDEKIETAVKDQTTMGDYQTVLLFKSGEAEQFAVALPMVKRIETISPVRVEKIGGKEYITIDGVSTLVIRIENHLKVSPCVNKDEMYLLLPKHYKNPYGVLMSSLIDTTETSIELNTDTYKEDGILGTSIIRDKMTLFPDLNTLVEMAEPAWFVGEKVIAVSKARILLVEDSPFYRQLVKKYLETRGYDVSTAENGQDALEKLKHIETDVLISDLQMPVMDGLQLIKHVRNNQRWKNLPTVALTGLNSETSRLKAEEAGFDRYALKADKERLLETVAELVASREAAA
ncbi:MAG: response regulator [Nitrospinae bacterium]|nr:response regulator [Nitrospinota bacterium]